MPVPQLETRSRRARAAWIPMRAERIRPTTTRRHPRGPGRQERLPKVVERLERHVDRQRLLVDIVQPVRPPLICERPARTQWHVPFIARRRGRIERDGRVPERPQHLHSLAVIPYGRGDDTAGTGDPDHLLQRGGRIRDEVQHEHRQRPIEGVVGERQRHRVADFEVAVEALLRVAHVGCRRFDARDLYRFDGRGRRGAHPCPTPRRAHGRPL